MPQYPNLEPVYDQVTLITRDGVTHGSLWKHVGSSGPSNEGLTDVIQSVNVKSVPGIDLTGSVDNRTLLYSQGTNIFIPKEVQVRCNLLPDDDVSIFFGEGQILTRDPWGKEHVFDVGLANGEGKNQLNAKEKISKAMRSRLSSTISFGFFGDSLTDAPGTVKSDGSAGVNNPTDASGNLNSTNYNHSTNGAEGVWSSVFWRNLIRIVPNAKIYNASSSGKKLIDGWAYRNFDYGLFQNNAYAIPDVVILAMGTNDVADGAFTNELFSAKLLQFAKKCWGYGCALVVVHNKNNSLSTKALDTLKRGICEKYTAIKYVELAHYLDDFALKNSYNKGLKDIYWNGTAYDDTHPQQIGHDIMGAGFFKDMFSEYIFFASEGLYIDGVNDKRIYYDNPTGLGINYVDNGRKAGWRTQVYNSFSTAKPYRAILFIWNEDVELALLSHSPAPHDMSGIKLNFVGAQNDYRYTWNSIFTFNQTNAQISQQRLSAFPALSPRIKAEMGNLRYGLNYLEIKPSVAQLNNVYTQNFQIVRNALPYNYDLDGNSKARIRRKYTKKVKDVTYTHTGAASDFKIATYADRDECWDITNDNFNMMSLGGTAIGYQSFQFTATTWDQGMGVAFCVTPNENGGLCGIAIWKDAAAMRIAVVGQDNVDLGQAVDAGHYQYVKFTGTLINNGDTFKITLEKPAQDNLKITIAINGVGSAVFMNVAGGALSSTFDGKAIPCSGKFPLPFSYNTNGTISLTNGVCEYSNNRIEADNDYKY